MGFWVLKFIYEKGGKIKVVSDVIGVIKNNFGIDIIVFNEYVWMIGGVKGFEGVNFLDVVVLFVEDCDVFIFVVFGGVING